jgi:hypothetical protein
MNRLQCPWDWADLTILLRLLCTREAGGRRRSSPGGDSGLRPRRHSLYETRGLQGVRELARGRLLYCSTESLLPWFAKLVRGTPCPSRTNWMAEACNLSGHTLPCCVAQATTPSRRKEAEAAWHSARGGQCMRARPWCRD